MAVLGRANQIALKLKNKKGPGGQVIRIQFPFYAIGLMVYLSCGERSLQLNTIHYSHYFINFTTPLSTSGLHARLIKSGRWPPSKHPSNPSAHS